jgi:hypothetical protein
MVRETEIEKYLKKLVEEKGGVCWKFTSSVSGVPDRVVLLPAGIVGFCEVKRQRGVPRPQQVKKILQIQRLGTNATWIDSKESARRFINEICS